MRAELLFILSHTCSWNFLELSHTFSYCLSNFLDFLYPPYPLQPPPSSRRRLEKVGRVVEAEKVGEEVGTGRRKSENIPVTSMITYERVGTCRKMYAAYLGSRPRATAHRRALARARRRGEAAARRAETALSTKGPIGRLDPKRT